MNRTKIEAMLKRLKVEETQRNTDDMHYFSERSTELRGMITVLTELLNGEEVGEMCDTCNVVHHWADECPDGNQPKQTSSLHSEDGEVKELYEKCPICNGDGYTAEHHPLDSNDQGRDSLIQVECDNCSATGKASQHSPIIKDGWISVEERMPTEAKHYLCYLENEPERTGQTIKYIEVRFIIGNSNISSLRNGERLTHWQPLPPAPSKGEAR